MIRIFLFALMLILLPGNAYALSIPVEASVSRLDGESDAELERRTRREIFAQAVATAAPTLLPGVLSPTRQQLLMDYLMPRAEDFVQGYTESGSVVIGDEMVVAATVEVDEVGLEGVLNGLGLNCNLNSAQTYTLELLPGAESARAALTGLQVLSGLVPGGYGEPQLTLQRDEAGWFGELAAAGRIRTAKARNIGDLWLTLWSGYFSGCNQAQGVVEVQVAGFATPDAPLALQAQLADLLPRYGQAKLAEVSVTSGELMATWLVEGDAEASVRQTWDQALQMIGLRVVYPQTDIGPDSEPDAEEGAWDGS